MQLSSTSNRPWELSSNRGELRIGRQRVAIGEIRSVARSAAQERDFLGSLLNYSAYLVVAAVFLVLVVQAGWRERFLLATLFFALVGVTSLIDIRLTTPIRLYSLRIDAKDGQQFDFTSPDPLEVDRLLTALNSALASSRS